MAEPVEHKVEHYYLVRIVTHINQEGGPLAVPEDMALVPLDLVETKVRLSIGEQETTVYELPPTQGRAAIVEWEGR